MKLSEAIRKGSAIRPQSSGAYFLSPGYIDGTSCALGAAYEALGLEPTRDNFLIWDTLAEEFPCLNMTIEGAELRGHTLNLEQFISLANDTGGTREEIADFLAAAGL